MSSLEDDAPSPWADMEPTDPILRKKADEAFERLVNHYLGEPAPKELLSRTARLNKTLEVYFAFSVRAAAEGLTDEDARKKFIMEGLQQDALIDPEDPEKADELYTIISEGYELNKPYWDEKLGRMRISRVNRIDLNQDI